MSKAELESVICDLLKALQRFPRHTGMIDRCHFTRQTVISVFRLGEVCSSDQGSDQQSGGPAATAAHCT